MKKLFSIPSYLITLTLITLFLSVIEFKKNISSIDSANLTHCDCRDAFIWSQSGYNAAGFSGKLPERSDCAKKYADEAAEGVAQNEMTYYGADVIFQSYFNRMCND